MARWIHERLVDEVITSFCRRTAADLKADTDITYRIERIDVGAHNRRAHVAVDLQTTTPGDGIWLDFTIVMAPDGTATACDIHAVRSDPHDADQRTLTWNDECGLWEPADDGAA